MMAAEDNGDGCPPTVAGNDDSPVYDSGRGIVDGDKQQPTTNHRRERGGRKTTIPHDNPTWLGGLSNLLLFRQQREQQQEQRRRLTRWFLVYGVS